MRYFIILCLLTGCVSDEEFARRGATRAPGYPALIIKVDDPHFHCRSLGATLPPSTRKPNGDFIRLADLNITHEPVIHGCAEWRGRLNPGRCTIIVGKDAPQWLIEHELLHCRYGEFH